MRGWLLVLGLSAVIVAVAALVAMSHALNYGPHSPTWVDAMLAWFQTEPMGLASKLETVASALAAVGLLLLTAAVTVHILRRRAPA